MPKVESEPPQDARGFLARYGATILRGGIAAIPSALYRYQGELGLGAQLIWFISAILAHKWDANMPHPSLVKMAEQTGVSRRQLHRYEQELLELGYLRIVNRQTAQGGKASNLYDFSTLFARLEAFLERDRPNDDPDEGGYVTPVSHRDVTSVSHRDVTRMSHLHEESVFKEELGRIDPSKFRKASTLKQAGDDDDSTRTPRSQPTRDRERHGASGFARVGSLLPATAPVPSPSTTYDEDRQVLLAYITNVAREFNDRASLKTSTTRALHLLEQSGLSRPAFIAKLYEARAITKERSAAIRTTTTTPGFPLPVKNKMPYFFRVLEQLLGLRPDEGNGDDPPKTRPAPAQDGATTGRDGARRPSDPSAAARAKTAPSRVNYDRLIER